MHSLEELSELFRARFKQVEYPVFPENLYHNVQYILGIQGKQIRPVSCLIANQLFSDIKEDAFHAGIAVELFHNSSLVHDDIMDGALLRRGYEALHVKNNMPTAILVGDLLIIHSFEYLNRTNPLYREQLMNIFLRIATGVCEGQQLDNDFENAGLRDVSYNNYIIMSELKTAVLLAGSLSMGAVIGGADDYQSGRLYDFGINLGIAFQIQDDYLDVFGDPAKTGKRQGGDIVKNKKTSLLTKTIGLLPDEKMMKLESIMHFHPEKRVPAVTALYRDYGIEQWAVEQVKEFTDRAFAILEEIDVPEERKAPLIQLAHVLLKRQY
ncbi:polyprenyl synthetase family protein [Chitinophaga solisilvae]|uniref:polyprenyl synthetase family protein n=1 Tax=Chitinophaga solisilvae TaxID=1233460 RepID=UPI001371ABD4|nr:polyprenyl synthetase family protein [Chitinophaga solisilvae]